MKRKLLIVLSCALLIVILDQITKALITQFIPQGSVIPIIPGIFDIVHGRNTGAAFGMLHGWNSVFKNSFFYLIGLLALLFLFHYMKTTLEKDCWSLAALGMILGGALGNIGDRLLRGSVVDFLSIHYFDKIWHGHAFGYQWKVPLSWPSFNVADSAICLAVGILVIKSVFQKNKPKTLSSKP